MPRKDLTEERTAQILDAFERCIARHGLDGTSLEQVAEEAEVKRSLIRHYIGNRDDLVRAAADRFGTRYRAQLQEMRDYASGAGRIDRLLECLFPPASPERFSEVLVAEAMIAAGEHDEPIREMMADVVVRTIETVRDVLLDEHPAADRRAAWNVAYGVVGVSFNYESLGSLALPARHRSAGIDAARRLIGTLDG